MYDIIAIYIWTLLLDETSNSPNQYIFLQNSFVFVRFAFIFLHLRGLVPAYISLRPGVTLTLVLVAVAPEAVVSIPC